MIEVYRNNENSMSTPEFARNWTEKSPNSKLGEIKNIINKFLTENTPKKKDKTLKDRIKDKVRDNFGKLLNISNTNSQNIKEIQTLKDKINRWEYRKFQIQIWLPYNKCDWKLWRESLSYLNNYLDKYIQQNNLIKETRLDLSNLKESVWIIENSVDTVRIQKAEDRYLLQYETMNNWEYNRLFSWLENLQQWQLGDCYLVSWIYELARAQHFDTLMRTSIQRVRWKDGSGKWYQIKIPLWEPSWRKILIKDLELNNAKIIWKDGYKLLELAYAKNKLRKNDKQGNMYKPITPSELKKITWWWTHEVLTTFLWKNNIGFSDFWTMKNFLNNRTLSQSSPIAKNEIYKFLKNYNPSIGNKFVSLVSLPWSSDSKSYTVWWKKIYRRHAYSLTWVNKDSKWEIKSIRVLNPWNTQWVWENYQDFTLNEFFNSFSAMSCGKIKTKEFLNHKSVS